MNIKSGDYSISKRLQSFHHAINGIAELLMSQQNARIHAVVAITVILAGFLLDVSAIEWCFLVMAIVSVLVCEAINTAFESLCDVVSPELHPLVKKSKDIAAGAVLLSVIGSVVIGLIIFLPYLYQYC